MNKCLGDIPIVVTDDKRIRLLGNYEIPLYALKELLECKVKDTLIVSPSSSPFKEGTRCLNITLDLHGLYNVYTNKYACGVFTRRHLIALVKSLDGAEFIGLLRRKKIFLKEFNSLCKKHKLNVVLDYIGED